MKLVSMDELCKVLLCLMNLFNTQDVCILGKDKNFNKIRY